MSFLQKLFRQKYQTAPQNQISGYATDYLSVSQSVIVPPFRKKVPYHFKALNRTFLGTGEVHINNRYIFHRITFTSPSRSNSSQNYRFVLKFNLYSKGLYTNNIFAHNTYYDKKDKKALIFLTHRIQYPTKASS